jgi:tetratricopeptide (TPR) repeat protein
VPPKNLLADGVRYERAGVVARALEIFQEVTTTEQDDPASAAEAWWRLANLHRLHAAWDAALHAAQRSAEIAEAHALLDTHANALNIEGATRMMRAEYDVARSLYQRVVALATTAATRAKGLQNLGGLEAELGNLDAGEEYFIQSRAQYRLAGDARGEANTLVNLGRLQSVRGQNDDARVTLEAAAGAARMIGDLEMHAAALLNLGIALGALGRIEEAEERITTAYGQFTIADIAAQRVRCLMQLATLAVRRSELGAARVCLDHARTVAVDAGLPRETQLIDEQLSGLGSVA